MTPPVSRNHHRIRTSFTTRQQPTDRPAAPAATGPTVLAVDDDPVLVEAMYAVLSAAGCNVLTSTRGTKGLELLQHMGTVVDVVVLDYQMPVTNGAQLLPSMRRLAPTAKILGISAADPDDLLPEFRDGVDKLLRKPFTRTDLISAVAALLPVAREAGPANPNNFDILRQSRRS